MSRSPSRATTDRAYPSTFNRMGRCGRPCGESDAAVSSHLAWQARGENHSPDRQHHCLRPPDGHPDAECEFVEACRRSKR